MADAGISSLVLFIVSLIVAASVAGVFATEVGQLTEDIDDLGFDASNRVANDIEIVSDTGSDVYDVGGNDRIRLYVKNTGTRELPTDPEQLDVLLDNQYQDAGSVTVTVLEGSAWSPGRVAMLEIDAPCVTAGDHRARVGVDGSRESVEFETPSGSCPTWYDPAWYNRKLITVDHTQVDADLTDYPVLVSITDADLAADAQNDGDDIVFAQPDGTKLDHEIESFDGSTGELVTWVRLPSLSSTTDTTFYLYYNNSGAANQENVAGVWNTDYRMVQHFEESSGTPTDSTSYGNDGTNNGATQGATGVADGAIDVSGSGDYVEVPDSINDGEFTIQVWFEAQGSSWTGTVFDATWGGDKYFFVTVEDDQAHWAFESADDSDVSMSSAASRADTTWHGVSVTGEFSSSGPHELYVDGTELASSTTTVDGKSNLDPPRIGDTTESYGDFAAPKSEFDGGLDEVRIVDRRLSSAWISTEYNNINDPSNFHTVGPEETQ